MTILIWSGHVIVLAELSRPGSWSKRVFSEGIVQCSQLLFLPFRSGADSLFHVSHNSRMLHGRKPGALCLFYLPILLKFIRLAGLDADNNLCYLDGRVEYDRDDDYDTASNPPVQYCGFARNFLSPTKTTTTTTTYKPRRRRQSQDPPFVVPHVQPVSTENVSCRKHHHSPSEVYWMRLPS